MSVFKSENTNAVDVSNVKLYASDPWFHTFDGKLENLAYYNQGNHLSDYIHHNV